VSNVLIDFRATIVYLTLSALVAVAGLIYWKRTGKPIVLLLMAGGIMCAVVEPFVNVMGAVWHPVLHQVTVFEVMGRPMPRFLVAGYLFYFGALGSMTFFAFARGVTVRQFWLWCCLPMLVDFVMEQLMLHYDLYYYYGNQPLLVGKLPVWWVPCNSLGQILGVAFIALVKPLQSGWKQLLIPLLIPVWDAIAYSAISIPAWIVVNSPTPGPLVQLGGLATCALAGLILLGLSTILPVDSLYRPSISDHSRSPDRRSITSLSVQRNAS
jgi:hypothetical protein